MKKILLLALPLMVMCAVSCEKDKENVNVEEWTDDSPIIQFKDPYFLENLITAAGIDKNGDGQISEKEASVVTELAVINGVRNIDEIRYFTALTYLACYGNKLTTLDVSNNTALTRLECFDNQLTSLDVSKNTALEFLYCGGNQLTTLDVSNNTALTALNCFDNQLTSLDVSKNTALEFLACGSNQLTTLDLSNNTALESLYCYSNNISSLDVSMCRDLSDFSCVDYDSYIDIDYDTKLPLESLKIYKYHIINDDDISVIEQVYGEILEYVE